MDHTTFTLCVFGGFAIITVPALVLLATLRYFFLRRF